MFSGENTYFWQTPNWPVFQFDEPAVAEKLARASRAQGLLAGRLTDLGFPLQDRASLDALTEDVIRTSAIEGETLNLRSVRSSVARRLGVDIGAVAPVDRHVEGVVEMVLDATHNFDAPLTTERLFGWHAALFPTGFSGLTRIRVGAWRDDAQGPMQVVSGPVGKQRVHFEAPPSTRLHNEIERFLLWFNAPPREPLLIKAALAHLWFVTLHPFDDGNGRIARAVGDLLLARSDRSRLRFYSLSAQIQRQRDEYYAELERAQKGDGDITPWVSWFLDTLTSAFGLAGRGLDGVLQRARVWQQLQLHPLNERQIKLVNRLLDGFEGKLTTSKWAAIAKCSTDTALRDINELVAWGGLVKTPAGGRSTSYELAAVEGG